MKRTFKHESNGQKYSEAVWQWNSWDPGKKTRLAAKLAKTRDAPIARQIILSTLDRVRIPEDGIVFWCDKLASYASAYQQLVREGKINPNIIKMISVPKKKSYGVINEIEAINAKWRGKFKRKLQVAISKGNSLENAELRLIGGIILEDFLKPRKEFKDKTSAQNANANVIFGANETEAIVKLSHILKQEKYKQYQVPPKKTNTNSANNNSQN
jgi:transposase-like protein